jgi:hypothetical protein
MLLFAKQIAIPKYVAYVYMCRPFALSFDNRDCGFNVPTFCLPPFFHGAGDTIMLRQCFLHCQLQLRVRFLNAQHIWLKVLQELDDNMFSFWPVLWFSFAEVGCNTQ